MPDIEVHKQLHSKKQTTCSGLMKTGLNNVVLPTLFKVVNILNKLMSLNYPAIRCNNIVDNLEQCGLQNIVQSCFHQARTGCAFFAVYGSPIDITETHLQLLIMSVISCDDFV